MSGTKKTRTKKRSNGEITRSMKKCIRKCRGDGFSKIKTNLCILKTADKCAGYTEYFRRSKECREKECKNEVEARKLDTTLLQSDTRKAVNECFNKKCSDLSLD